MSAVTAARRQLSCKDSMLSEQPDRVTVVGRRPPAFRRADVLRDIDTGLDGGNKGVLHAAQPHGILTALLAGSGFLPQDGSVVGDAPKQPQNAIFVYHWLPRLPVTLAANSRCARVMRGSSSK